ncbi:MAG TPA: DUF2937 family protein [Hypericibacter adhaerens]|uniref:DUF2937 family protein n=1 Tax=Hypericibacter adhaerens TaxID=2602016 RepID=UPI002CDC4CD4|nr:DUF2937 family protein [Hypericibacter adhaerens]HWA43981.1 DUF2937 family protein [Hypericibacter adhaerens]
MRRTLALVGGLALGLCFSQFPEYAQQYEQRLGGAVDELRAVVDNFDRDATRFGLTRQQALARFAVSPDQFLVARGTSMDATIARYDDLRARLAELQGAGPLERLMHLGDYLDGEIGGRALAAYKPAVPVTPEGLGWGAAGLVLGYLLADALIGVLTLPFRWRRGRPPHRRVPLWWRQREIEIDTVTLEQLDRARLAARRPDADRANADSGRQET